MKKSKRIFAAMLVLSLCIVSGAVPASAKTTAPDGRLPTMGWSSWNPYMMNINETKIKSQADALVDSGLRDKGYTYVIVDDGCLNATRDADGKLRPQLDKFPSGFAALGDYLHNNGLKFGMYNCAGTKTCLSLAGSYNHEYTDAQTFAEWGTDYLKYDFCYNPLVNMPLYPVAGAATSKSFVSDVVETMSKEAPPVRKIVIKEVKDGVVTELKTISVDATTTTVTGGAVIDTGYGAGTPCLAMLDANDDLTKGGSGTISFTMDASEIDPAAKYSIDVYCINPDKERLLSMLINPDTAQYPYFYIKSAKTPSWSVSDAQPRNLQNVPLTTGTNTIEFYLSKQDLPNGFQQDTVRSYEAMSKALEATGREVIFNICEWGYSRPYEWAGQVGNAWRNTTDISFTAGSVKWDGDPNGRSIVQIYDRNVVLDEYAGPYSYNDPDQLCVGLSGISEVENRAHFTLWCMMASPLIAGTDLVNASPTTIEILGNTKAIALDQDELCLQAKRILQADGVDYLVKPLFDGSVALCMFNRTNTNKTGSVSVSNLAAAASAKVSGSGTDHLTDAQKAMFTNTFANAASYTTEDIWTNAAGTLTSLDTISADITAHGVVTLVIAPTK